MTLFNSKRHALPMTTNAIAENISHILKDIESIPHTQSVTCLAVSKGHPTMAIEEAYQAGLEHFGENYLQEAISKIEKLQHLKITWHFIGRIQSKKCKKIAQYFDWVHSVDTIDVAQKLNDANQALNKKQNICLQVNLLNEEQKGGCHLKEIKKTIEAMTSFKSLNLKGFMTILPEDLNPSEQCHSYEQLKTLLQEYNQEFGLNLSTLSMGMSKDYKEAIQSGSTMIRIGSAIFGPRPPKGLV